jgi:hypothetical protein
MQVGPNRLMGLVARNSGISPFDFGVAEDCHFDRSRAVQP